MNHEINLTGYTASCNAADNMLCLGTAGSYGLEKLHVTADAVWDGLTITATFTNSGSTTVAVTGGAVDVPPEATRLPTRDRVRYGQIAFKGADADGSIRLISTPVYYKVQASSATDGENTIAPTPDQYAQFVAEVTAEAAANRAESAGGNVTPEQIAAAVNNYLTENPVQATPIDATLTQSGQAADAAVVGNRLSALSEEIAAIPSGKDGADGKSAYQYAQDGGYTGTETEFAAKLAEEMPEAYSLPIASSTVLGGVNPVAKTEAMTKSVGVDGAGALWTEPGSAGSAVSTLKKVWSVDVTEPIADLHQTINFAGPVRRIVIICKALEGSTSSESRAGITFKQSGLADAETLNIKGVVGASGTPTYFSAVFDVFAGGYVCEFLADKSSVFHTWNHLVTNHYYYVNPDRMAEWDAILFNVWNVSSGSIEIWADAEVLE